jgi:hypothetical protein
MKLACSFLLILLAGCCLAEELRWSSKPQLDRHWGPEQATGEPDTFEGGDMVTAWASLSTDDQQEWLALEYDQAVTIRTIVVYESFNPGALIKITALNADGEKELWSGVDPSPRARGQLEQGPQHLAVSTIELPAPAKANRIKLYLDSKSVRGWNEVDAVALIGTDGSKHWATKAASSTTFAEQNDRGLQRTQHLAIVDLNTGQVVMDLSSSATIEGLQQQVQALTAEANELRQKLEEMERGKSDF